MTRTRLIWVALLAIEMLGCDRKENSESRPSDIDTDTATGTDTDTATGTDTSTGNPSDSDSRDTATETVGDTDTRPTGTASGMVIEVTPLRVNLRGLEDRLRFAAECVDGSGQGGICTDWVTWSSSDEGVATISNDPETMGLATPVSVGRTLITASLGGVVSNEAELVVSSVFTCDPLMVLAPRSDLEIGDTVQLDAQCLASGQWVDLSNVVEWWVALGDSVTVDDTGLVTGVGCGGSTVDAAFTFANGTRITAPPVQMTVRCDDLPDGGEGDGGTAQ